MNENKERNHTMTFGGSEGPTTGPEGQGQMENTQEVASAEFII